MRQSGTWLTIAWIIGVCGCQKPSTAPSTAAAQFLALGDSYTIGEGVDESDRWPVQLARRLREEAHIDLGEPRIIAHTGWTTSDLSFAVDVENPNGPFNLVSLLIGVNNQFRHGDIDTFRTQFAELLKRSIGFAGGDSKHVIVLSIPDWGQTPYAQDQDREQIANQIDAFNSVCKQECEKQKVMFVDVTPISRRALSDPTLVAPDGLHPSAAMYQKWVEAIYPHVKSVLGEQQ